MPNGVLFGTRRFRRSKEGGGGEGLLPRVRLPLASGGTDIMTFAARILRRLLLFHTVLSLLSQWLRVYTISAVFSSRARNELKCHQAPLLTESRSRRIPRRQIHFCVAFFSLPFFPVFKHLGIAQQ